MLPAIGEGVGWNLRPWRSEEGRPLINEAAYEHATLVVRMTLDDTVYIDIFMRSTLNVRFFLPPINVVHTMNAMSGAMQFSRGWTSVVVPVATLTE